MRDALKLAILVFGSSMVAFAAGAYSFREDLPPIPQVRSVYHHIRGPRVALEGTPEGARFQKLPTQRHSGSLVTDEQAEEIRRLQAIGYVAGSAPTRAETDVTRHDPDRTYPGFNLYSDGHEAQATLMDMSGEVIHQWSYPFDEAFPDAEIDGTVDGVGYWRRVWVTEAGELYGVYEGHGMIKLDVRSKLVWAYPERAHHDFEVLPDGGVYVLVREAEMVPSVSEVVPTLNDYIALLSPEGREVKRVSILETIDDSAHVSLRALLPEGGDILHTNALELLDGKLAHRIPAFEAGNVLVSFPGINTIAVIDIEDERMVWALAGLAIAQHQPTVLDSGNILLFDNRGDRGRSRVIEFDPTTQEIAWMYEGSKTGFYSSTCGAHQRLPNGNTLITETDSGRAFEVTDGGDMVWEFYSPNRAGEDDEYIASLFELIRLPADFPVGWATGR